MGRVTGCIRVSRRSTTTNGVRRAGGEVHYRVERYARRLAKSMTEPFSRVASKKGLQVQMTDDAIGARREAHAGLNVDLAALVDLGGGAGAPAWQVGWSHLSFSAGICRMRSTRELKKLSDAGMGGDADSA